MTRFPRKLVTSMARQSAWPGGRPAFPGRGGQRHPSGDPPRLTNEGEGLADAPQPTGLGIEGVGRACAGPRDGLTLLEVLLSLGLFLGALAALSQLWYGGVRASVQSRLATQAILRCESKMNEVVAGAVSLVSTADTPFEDDPEWTWNMQVTPGPHSDTLLVVVNVSHPGRGGLSSSGFQLTRLIRDPVVWAAARESSPELQP